MGFSQSGNSSSKNAKRQPSGNKKKTTTTSAKLFLAAVLILLGAFLAIVCYKLSPDSNISSPSDAFISSDSLPQEDSATLPSESLTSANLDVSEPVSTTKQPPKPSPGIVNVDQNNWELVLVNTNYRLPDGYVPPKLLTVVNDCRLDSRVVPHYLDMYNAALSDGVKLTPFSGYRTYEVQKRNYNNKINYYKGIGYDEEEAAVKASTVIMPPGSSEHNLGFAMDIVTCDTWFETTDEFTWLRENAYKYGFIMRYAKEKTDITGVIYEPWHWRYVGVDAATDIYQTRNADGVEICLEEYLGVS